MPGYYEHEDIEGDIDEPSVIPDAFTVQDPGDTTKASGSSRPPVSAPASSTIINSAGTTSKAGPSRSRATSHPPQVSASVLKTKPSSSSNPTKRKRTPSVTHDGIPAIDVDDIQTHTCPICSKTLETDNRGLNEHVDFCLSKGAIREAQATSHNIQPLKQPLPIRSKPGVKMKKPRKK